MSNLPPTKRVDLPAYQITPSTTAVLDSGAAEGGSTTTLRDDQKQWDTDIWAGYLCYITRGGGAGNFRVIDSNTFNTLTFVNALVGGGVDQNTQYFILQPAIPATGTAQVVIIHDVQATTTAATALWTPTSGKKFRIMGGAISVAGGTLAAGANLVSLLDGATDIGLDFSFWVGIAATPIPLTLPFTLPGDGKLSAAANNVLNVTLSAAMTAGNMSVTVWGVEE